MLVADLETSYAHLDCAAVVRTDGIFSFSLLGGSSKVDILIATPGRLMDHLHATSNFSLQHLRFLVGPVWRQGGAPINYEC